MRFLALVLLLLACGSPARVCDLSTCPSGCCTLDGICLGGTAACGGNPGAGGGSASGTGGGSIGSAGGAPSNRSTCAAPVYTVSGSLPNATGTLNAYDSVAASRVDHKRDVDPVEDGCIVNVELTLKAAGQCELKVKAGGKKLASGSLLVTSVSLTANSQCPGFLDAQEGIYENKGALTTAELALSTATAPGRNVAESCWSTQMTLKLEGTLHRKTDDAPLRIAASQLSISGPFTSQGDVALKCLETCTDCSAGAGWKDPATNLTWEHPARFAMSLPDGKGTRVAANVYCAALTTGGVAPGTWRVPSIDELRTLIRNNPATQTGGTCNVCTACSGSCLSPSCHTGCITDTPVSHSCAYLPPELAADCARTKIHFSSTRVTNTERYWTVWFDTGSVMYGDSWGGVHCVRD